MAAKTSREFPGSGCLRNMETSRSPVHQSNRITSPSLNRISSILTFTAHNATMEKDRSAFRRLYHNVYLCNVCTVVLMDTQAKSYLELSEYFLRWLSSFCVRSPSRHTSSDSICNFSFTGRTLHIDFWINILLCLIGFWIVGAIHAVSVGPLSQSSGRILPISLTAIWWLKVKVGSDLRF